MFQASKINWTGAILLSILLVTGCNSNKPSTSTFKQALQKDFDADSYCKHGQIHLANFPIEVIYDDQGKGAVSSNSGLWGEASIALAGTLATLKDAGLLTAQDGEKAITTSPSYEKAIMSGNSASTTKMHKTTTYSIAPAYASYFRNQQDLCYARVHVKNVDNYTEPSDRFGQTLSEVSYTYDLKPIAPWTQNAGLQKALPILKSMDTEQHEKKILVLTHNGWMPPK